MPLAPDKKNAVLTQTERPDNVTFSKELNSKRFFQDPSLEGDLSRPRKYRRSRLSAILGARRL
jgi:hypothetical protein